MRFIAILTAVLMCSVANVTAAESTSLVEVRNGKTVTTGRVLARDNAKAVVLDRKGSLHTVEVKNTPLKPVNGSFQGLPVTEFRNQLSREFGKEFEVGTTRHYLVVAPPGRAAKYAAVFEDQYSTLQRYLKTRSFMLNDVEFPLVAVVFANRQQFVDYAQAEGAKTMTGMLGYYSPRTNRVALFESRGKSVAETNSPENENQSEFLLSRNGRRTAGLFAPPTDSLLGSIQGDLQATMIHEATHQVAYNFGLHSRLGETPRWVCEGLATTFEAEGIRDSSAGRDVKQRMNRERFIEFQNYVKSRRPAKSLNSFVEGDSLYDSAISDFYAQSWALTFFLVETRPRNYSAYLKRIAARDPFTDYPASERLADFRETIHKDVDWLDVQFLRFIDGLK